VIGVPAGIVGARLLDVLEYPWRYGSWATVLGPSGSSIYGALLLNLAITTAFLKTRGIGILRFLDAGGPAIALGEALSRVGCFLNGCCYGVPWNSRFAVRFPPESFIWREEQIRGAIGPSAAWSASVHPVQLYSSALSLVAFVLLLRRFLRPHRPGGVFFAALVYYGSLRLLVAPLREEVLPSMVAFSLGFIAVGIFGLTRRGQDERLAWPSKAASSRV